MLKSRHSFKRTYPVTYKRADSQDTETSLPPVFNPMAPWVPGHIVTLKQQAMRLALCIGCFSCQHSCAGFITYAVGLLHSKPDHFYTEQHNFTHGYIFEQIKKIYVNGLYTDIPKYMHKFFSKILLKTPLYPVQSINKAFIQGIRGHE